MRHVVLLVLLASATVFEAGGVHANGINTGPPDGPYQTGLCPRLTAELGRAKLDYRCQTSDGAKDNIQKVASNPRDIGFAPLDVLAIEAPLHGGVKAFARIRTGDIRECIFAVTRNRDLNSYGDLVANAPRLRFVLPPKASPSAATFGLIRQGDPDGIGKAKEILNAAHVREAITLSLSADDTVGFFVAPPDPSSDDFKTISRLGGHVVGVLDRPILRQQIDGEKIYFAEETEVTRARWIKTSAKVVTSCTPLVLFTGAPERISDPKARQDHADMIATLKALKTETVLPPQGGFRRFVARSRELSGASVEKLLSLSETARERSGPYFEKAKEATRKAIEASKPAMERAKELGSEALEKAKQKARELAKPTPPDPAPKPQ